MSLVSDVMQSVQTSAVSANEAKQTKEVKETTRKSNITGKTIGNPQLSDKAAKYYEELKKKFSNMDFILVSDDRKDMAKSQAASYGNASKMVVLIDESKIERMAEDANFRKQYESIITNGANSLSQMAQKLKASGISVKSFGMQVKDNRASFFAAVDKSFASQRERQQKRIADKKEAKKAEAKKAKKKEDEKERAEKLDEKRKPQAEEASDEMEVLYASSVEELIQKLQDYQFARMSDNTWTETEKLLGQHIDFGV